VFFTNNVSRNCEGRKSLCNTSTLNWLLAQLHCG
jgi:hypothetical protein